MPQPIQLLLNQALITCALPPGAVALDLIRRQQGLTATKEGCREGECGACTVLLGRLEGDRLRYRAVASCLLPVGDLAGCHLVTLEGLNGADLSPLQVAFVEHNASQCGFCTPGFLMATTGFLLNSPDLAYSDALDAVDGNLCRCTGYHAIRRALRHLCRQYAPRLQRDAPRIPQLVDWGLLPAWFPETETRLRALPCPECEEPGPEWTAVAGATDLLVQRPDELYDGQLAFLSGREDCCGVQEENSRILIGGAVNVEDLKQAPPLRESFPHWQETMHLISSTLMRNRATVAGNLVNASPIGDLSVLLLALDTELVLVNNGTTRTLPLEEFFLEYKKTALRKGEIIRSLSFTRPGANFNFNFEKVARRRSLDIASCNSACSFELEQGLLRRVRLSAGGVAPIPLLLRQTMGVLEGQRPEQHVLQRAAAALETEIKPISDIRGSAAYKGLLCRQLLYAHFHTLLPEQIPEEALP